MVVSQPSFLSVMHKATIDAFGPLAEIRYPARSVLGTGVPFVASSDAPTGESSPSIGIAEAMERGASTGRAIGRSEALWRTQAIESYVHDGTYAMSQDDWRTVLEAGRAADLIVVDRNPLGVLMTMVPGSIERDAMGAQTTAVEKSVC
jgi:predicted amidohydrolase YtcJ